MSSNTSRPEPVVAPKVEESQFLTFFVAGEEYGVGILEVREIIEYTTITKVPSMPPCIRGVINLRGQVVPVVDLALRFGLPQTQITKWTCVVMVEVDLDGEKTMVGLLADSVSQVLEFHSDDIEPPPAFGTRVRVDFISGMGKMGKKFVLILKLEKVLAGADLLSGISASKSLPSTASNPPEDARPEQAAAASGEAQPEPSSKDERPPGPGPVEP